MNVWQVAGANGKRYKRNVTNDSKIHSKIDNKSMRKRCSKKWCQNDGKLFENRPRKESKNNENETNKWEYNYVYRTRLWDHRSIVREDQLTDKGGTTPTGHQLENLFRTRTSSESVFCSMLIFASILYLFDHLELQKWIPKRAWMAFKINPKTKRKITLGMSPKTWEHHKNARC